MPQSYRIAYHRDALAFLQSLKNVKLRRQIIKKIEALLQDPMPKGRCEVVKGMEDGGDHVYRIKQGKHRILYAVRHQTIMILDIDHRKDVYRRRA